MSLPMKRLLGRRLQGCALDIETLAAARIAAPDIEAGIEEDWAAGERLEPREQHACAIETGDEFGARRGFFLGFLRVCVATDDIAPPGDCRLADRLFGFAFLAGDEERHGEAVILNDLSTHLAAGAPRMYSIFSASRAAMVSALIMPRSATMQA